MDERTKKTLICTASSLAGGWVGAAAMARAGAALGLRLGPVGTIAGAVVGAAVGAGLCRMLAARADEEEELTLDMEMDEVAPEKEAA